MFFDDKKRDIWAKQYIFMDKIRRSFIKNATFKVKKAKLLYKTRENRNDIL